MDDLLATLRHYIDRVDHLVIKSETVEGALEVVPWPGTFPAGQHFAVALGFAARAALKPAGRTMPAFPDQFTAPQLRAMARQTRAALDGLTGADLRGPVTHVAGFANLEQTLADYLLRFAFPNMIFHLTAGYAGLRQAGVAVGKADVDGLHAYPDGFTF
ncbi:DUF1993 family protein [Loktanella sp. IMCC34160]|uniref:DUF1993 family protein n=1 Tax=Loktanella sp. IMCC34160 TaxID=2510646 RepID=UPI00101BE08A|nr:DUF1993 family protein [Loktanella sp. IMCC34160]RYG90718.1 DUF1993 family protein [Loktanella sp. IMCC34160]